MDNKEFKRLRRINIVQFMLILVMMLGIVAYFSFELRKLNDLALASVDRPAQIIKGIDGKDGNAGLPGLSVVGPIGPDGSNGTNGKDGQGVSGDQIAAAVTHYLTLNPVTAIQGTPGVSSPALHIQVDPTSCRLESQYDGDDGWAILAQLPQPCEASL